MVLTAAERRLPCLATILPRWRLLSSTILPRRTLGGQARPERKSATAGKEFRPMQRFGLDPLLEKSYYL
jgi:hypothetical protein